MRGHKKVDGKWVAEELPDDPAGFFDWLYRHDCQEVIVADDEAKVYYCARKEEFDQYLAKGKSAKMFSELADLFWKNMAGATKVFEAVNEVFPGAKLESMQDFS